MAALEDLSGKFFAFKLNKSAEDIACLKRTLYKFCKTGKKSDAFSVYYCFCEIFKVFGPGYGSMKRLLEFLSDHEFHSGELLTKHRDHYSHSVYVFALGLAVYAGDGTFRTVFKNFYKNEKADDTFFLRVWGLTSLFHDIGYPFQLAHEQIKTYVQGMWGEDALNPSVSYEDMEGLLNAGGVSAGELLADGINRRLGYPVDVLRGLLYERYRRQRGFMDHGYFSALLLCRRFTETGTAVSGYITDVLTAIALHNNLNRYDIKKALNTDVAVPVKKHPLAYLLILCDELQDWDRKAFGAVSKKDPLAWKVELEIGGGVIDVTYVFDGFSVVDTVETEENGKKRIKTVSRLNVNADKILGGKFVADIKTLVAGGLKIIASAREDKKIKEVRNFASSESFMNLCDFAEAIHRSYQSVFGGEDFEDLSLEFKLSNIEQAKSYADKLELINCFYSDKELDYPVVTGFVKEHYDDEDGKRDDLGFLAREEHLRWVREKLDSGWKYGTDYSTKTERNAKKIHRDIIPFDCLDEDTKRKDELMVENMVSFLYHFGHGVRIYSYRGGRKPVLNIAGCGHRTASMNNDNLKKQIKDVLRRYTENYRVIVSTNFAFGADQLITECAAELGITIKAALPLPYEDYISSIKEDAAKYRYPFTGEDELRMRHLLAQTVTCKVIPDKKYIYLEASKHIINKCNKLIALWDGVETILQDEHGNPINQGGTWHNICIARNSRGLKDEDIHIIKCER